MTEYQGRDKIYDTNSNPGPETNSCSEHLKRGLCFNCNEHGHLAKDCPKPQKTYSIHPSNKQAAAVELSEGNDFAC